MQAFMTVMGLVLTSDGGVLGKNRGQHRVVDL